MKIIGADKRNQRLIVDMTEDELAQMMGFAGKFSLKDRAVPEVGTVIPVGQVFNDANDALEQHFSALKAANSLKAASTRFLNFFKDAAE